MKTPHQLLEEVIKTKPMTFTLKKIVRQYDDYRNDLVTVFEVEREDGAKAQWETKANVAVGDVKKETAAMKLRWQLKESIDAPPKKKRPIKKMGGWQCPECLTLMTSDITRGDITYQCLNDGCSEYKRKVRV